MDNIKNNLILRSDTLKKTYPRDLPVLETSKIGENHIIELLPSNKKYQKRNHLKDPSETLQPFINAGCITMDIDLKKFELEQRINSVEPKIIEKEKARNMKMQTDFEKERNYLIDQQKAIKHKIESTSNGINNERVINVIKSEVLKSINQINAQQELFNRLYNFNSDIIIKITKLKNNQKETIEKIEKKRNELKSLFLDNINLLEKVKNLKSLDKSLETVKDNKELIENHPHQEKEINSNDNLRNIYGFDKIINISSAIEENINLKEKFNNIKRLKSNTNLVKNELDKTILKCGTLNQENINLCRIFTDGINEISKEILKIHEVQKTQINSRNLSRNNLYYGLVKGRTQHYRSNSENFHSDTIIQAKSLISIKEKYKKNVNENIEPHNVIYNVITNLFKENKQLYEKYRVKMKKLDWSEFQELNSYQIFALLFINEGSLKTAEAKLFPKTLKIQPTSLLFLTGMTDMGI